MFTLGACQREIKPNPRQTGWRRWEGRDKSLQRLGGGEGGTPLIPALGRQKSNASLVYRVNSRTARATTEKPCRGRECVVIF